MLSKPVMQVCFFCTKLSLLYASRFPFYYELKIVFILWLLSSQTRGGSVLYRRIIHPTFERHESVSQMENLRNVKFSWSSEMKISPDSLPKKYCMFFQEIEAYLADFKHHASNLIVRWGTSCFNYVTEMVMSTILKVWHTFIIVMTH